MCCAGRNVPHERMLAVAEHYYHFGGRSPINDQCRELIAALEKAGVGLPIYWGNRNWHPMLADTVQRMRDDGIRSALAIATSAFGSVFRMPAVSRRYRGGSRGGPGAPAIEKLPPFWNHAGFIETMVDRVRDALARLPGADVVYTAHSIPVSMAQSSPYEQQLREAASWSTGNLGWASRCWRFRAAAVRRRSPGWSRISAITSGRLRRSGWSWCRSVFCPITWK